MKRFSILTACMLSLSGPASALTLDSVYSGLFFFGDSLVDDGNLGAAAPPPPYFEGQFSNGPVWADILDDTFADGTTQNYAYGGARAVTTGEISPGVDIPDLSDQLGLFAADLAGVDIGPGGEIFEGTPTVGARPLVSIMIGGNDLFATVQTFGAALAAIDPAAPIAEQEAAALAAFGAALTEAGEVARSVAGAVATLIAAPEYIAYGFADFLVANVPDLGLTPFLNTTPIAGEATLISAEFNRILAAELALLRGPVNITEVDLFGFLQGAAAGDILPDLTNVTDSCVDLLPTGLCNPDEFLFWDGVHPTALVHASLAEQVRLTLVPLPASAALLIAGLGGLAALRRRKTA